MLSPNRMWRCKQMKLSPRIAVKQMNQQLIDLKSKLEKANQHIESLQKQMFTVDRFRGDDSSIKFYTGFPNWDTFDAVFKYLNPGNEGQNISYWVSKLNLNVSAGVYEGENEESEKEEDQDS